jgi:hypothetical protein
MKTIRIFFVLLISILFKQSLLAQSTCVGTAGQVRWSYWAGFKGVPDTTDLFVLENFPTRPDGTQLLGSTQSPYNYSDYSAAMIRGFINIPVAAGPITKTYQFNVTADDRGLFYLSPNDNPASKIKRIETTTWTYVGENNKEAAQTSAPISLTQNVNYYFELYNFEGGYSDHINLYWREVGAVDTTWRILDFRYLKEYTCGQVCPPRGTACNDNNANTTNDQQDGFCNCVGKPTTTNICVGTANKVEAFYYDNILGDYVEPDLISNPRFPLQPHRKELINGAYGPLAPSTRDQYGSFVQGYITVPVTGSYSFNITGDNQTIFNMSKNDSVQYKQTYQAISFFGVGETEHNRFSFQTIGPMVLEKNKYYYYEIRHKENGWRDYFNLYWKTPFHEQKTWKKIPSFYLHDYACDVACVPAGTPCNDNNPNTNDDQYNGSCDCVGTPCVGAACNDIVGQYQAFEACNCTQSLVPSPDFAWESCNNAANPNTARAANQRWIKYDFGEPYLINGTRIWNYNVAGDTDKGFKNVMIDYSLNGTTWTPLSTTPYTWNQASGIADYAGFLGPNFGGQKIRYLLISAVDNYGDAVCSGFSKITFDAQLCNPAGTLCDDDDPLTIHDKFDANCNCAGVKIECAQDLLALGSTALLDTTYRAVKKIEASNKIQNTQHVSFTAGNSIVFLPGFEVKATGVFKAEIKNCLQVAYVQNQNARKASISDSTKLAAIEADENPLIKKIIFKLAEPGQVRLHVENASGELITELLNDNVQSTGTITKMLPTQRLAKGTYAVVIKIKDQDEIRETFEVN